MCFHSCFELFGLAGNRRHNPMKIRTQALLAATFLATMSPAVASAQTAADPATTTVAPQDDDDDFPWGLLGLLGLAGLLGRKRRDDDVHVDRSANTNRKM
jgi:hypothetical protein